jgi:DNA-binding PadR family transcriptional regulator
MKYLPKIEEIILLSIWKLQDNAYGTTIIAQVEKDTGSSWVSGSVYSALARLKKNRYITVVKTERAPENQGRPRIYYKLTDSGRQKLQGAQKVNKRMWDGIPDFEKAL